MSDPLRIGLIAEGVTDYEVINAIAASALANRPFALTPLQPEESVAFTGAGAAGATGGGWRGVYKWSRLLRNRAGKFTNDVSLSVGHDLFIMHLDADVAGENFAADTIRPIPELKGVLPCEEPCPPASATTDRLRQMMIDWLGEKAIPPQMVLCTPSKSMEAWVVAICFPKDKEASKPSWECRARPENRLGQQPKRVRFEKRQRDYRERRRQFAVGWPALIDRLQEARRFNDEFVAVVSAFPI